MDYPQAITCASLCQEVYQKFSDALRFRGFPNSKPIFFDVAQTDTQGAIVATDSVTYLVFRGSETDLDWDTNFKFKQEVLEFDREVIKGEIVENREQIYPYQGESRSGAKMHQGFSGAYLSVREQIHNYLRSHSVARVIVTGHSLGGALATLCAVDLQYNFSQVAIEIYTFGAPRVGNDGFSDSFNRRVPNSYRIINGMDIVPALPRPWQGYRHVDQEHRVGRRFSLNFLSQRFKDHALDGYLSSLKEKL
jgi:predicted lipase